MTCSAMSLSFFPSSSHLLLRIKVQDGRMIAACSFSLRRMLAFPTTRMSNHLGSLPFTFSNASKAEGHANHWEVTLQVIASAEGGADG